MYQLNHRRRGSSYSFYLTDTDINRLDEVVHLQTKEGSPQERFTQSSAIKEAIELLHNKYFPTQD